MTEAEPTLPDHLFRPLASRIAEVAGIHVATTKRWLLAARVRERMRAVDQETIGRYVDHVLEPAGAAELGRLVEALRVGETQFFRHQAQLRLIRRVALPEIVARLEAQGTRRVRVWSAGCATGEEAYTLAMMLEDELPVSRGWHHEIWSTDLSERALAVARAGVYPAASAVGVPPDIAAWALEPDGDQVRITARARSQVRFEHRNLLDAAYPRDFDLILCRNVLIYFDRATQQEVALRLSRALAPGGYLALGYAERLEAVSGLLTPLRSEDGTLYHRADPSDPPARVPRDPRPAASPKEVRRPGAHTAAAPGPVPRTRPAAAAATEVKGATDQRPPPSRGVPIALERLEGELEGEEGTATASAAIGRLLASEGRPVLDVRDLRFADDGVARVLARAAAALDEEARPLVVLATAPGILRFLRRHGVVPPAEVRSEPPEALP